MLVDGEAIDSCIYLAVWAEGRTILTVEGLRGPNGELSPIQQAFIEEAAVQCGFCTPGLIMTAVEIVGSGKRYTREELRKQISGISAAARISEHLKRDGTHRQRDIQGRRSGLIRRTDEAGPVPALIAPARGCCFGSRRFAWVDKDPRLAAAFFGEMDFADLHGAVDGLAHVVNGEQRR